ncbi:Quinol monooxygenase YgiN [Duganella sp. CF517]|uniref:putative quinol monooxygenase n=1 Tax=Duganella sp. CF517 TaxID=1881038 RepID=UPI0008D26A57|nr:putative quinol monooxygenase [Duganella sp. CF517]SEN37353.1 Quinol monooxygenase YgiN [Duganella sp. CF517]
MSELIIVATITAHSGSELLVRSALDQIVPPSRAETGCIRYDLHQDLGDPATFVMLEAWDDAEAHALHETTPHFLEMVNTIGKVTDIKITKLNQLL